MSKIDDFHKRLDMLLGILERVTAQHSMPQPPPQIHLHLADMLPKKPGEGANERMQATTPAPGGQPRPYTS